LKHSQDGEKVVETLNQAKDFLVQMIPPAQEMLDGGITINFRHAGDSVFIDVTVGGVFEQQASGVLSLFAGLKQTEFAGHSTIHLSTQLSPADIPNQTLDDNLTKATNIRYKSEGEWQHLKAIVDYAMTLKDMLPGKFREILFLIKIIDVIKGVNFNFVYDHESLKHVITDAINMKSTGSGQTQWEKLTQEWPTKQTEITQTVEGVSQMGKGVLQPFQSGIDSINFDEISIFALSSALRVHTKLTIKVAHLTAFINKQLA